MIMGAWTAATTTEISVEASRGLKLELRCNSAMPLLGRYPKTESYHTLAQHPCLTQPCSPWLGKGTSLDAYQEMNKVVFV